MSDTYVSKKASEGPYAAAGTLVAAPFEVFPGLALNTLWSKSDAFERRRISAMLLTVAEMAGEEDGCRRRLSELESTPLPGGDRRGYVGRIGEFMSQPPTVTRYDRIESVVCDAFRGAWSDISRFDTGVRSVVAAGGEVQVSPGEYAHRVDQVARETMDAAQRRYELHVAPKRATDAGAHLTWPLPPGGMSQDDAARRHAMALRHDIALKADYDTYYVDGEVCAAADIASVMLQHAQVLAVMADRGAQYVSISMTYFDMISNGIGFACEKGASEEVYTSLGPRAMRHMYPMTRMAEITDVFPIVYLAAGLEAALAVTPGSEEP